MADNDASPHATWLKRLLAALIWASMAALFGVTGWFFGVKPLAIAVGNWQLARDYQATPAQIVQRSAKAPDGTQDTWLAARYEAGGKTFHAERLTVLDDDDPDEPSNAAVVKTMSDALGKDQAFTVWVSPRKPEIALVSRELPVRSLWSRLPMAIGFSIFALAGLAGTVGALANPGYYRRLFDAAGIWGFAAAWCGFIFAILIVVAAERQVETFALAFVGFFAAIGVLLIWSAVSVSLFGNPDGASVRIGSRKSKLPASALATTGGRKVKTASVGKGDVKRGGIGGRGDGFDKT